MMSMKTPLKRTPYLLSIFCILASCVLSLADVAVGFPVSEAAWSDQEWEAHCEPARTSYNPDVPLTNEALTLTVEDQRFLDFLYWVWANKITEHQVEQVGGTGWPGPTDGVIFHWAPGSRWETHTTLSFEHAIHHVADEHHWMDNMFQDFFGRFGPVRGVNIAERLSLTMPPTWEQFLRHVGGSESPYYRYVFHQESVIDPERRTVTMVGGQGVLFEYSFERYLNEVKEVLTDCKSYQFFELYDLYGQGFASRTGWAGQPLTVKSVMSHIPHDQVGAGH